MRYLFFLLVLTSAKLQAQTLNFDKRYVECEDKWVAFQMNKDSDYIYGFIYIDAQAGLTLNYEGTFKISQDGKFVPKKLDSTSMKVRLQPNQVRVAVIPNEKFEELQIIEYPDWLRFYKTDTASIERLYRWGFLYNEWDQCEKALTYLERAKIINPKFPGLTNELAFAYNALGQYDKTITVLNEAMEFTKDLCYLYKELSYAELKSGNLEKAVERCKKGISLCTKNSMKAEIAYNMAYSFYTAKDKTNFKYWSDETKKWATQGDQFMRNINIMEANIEKQ